MSEETSPAVLAVLPPDAPAGHKAHQRVKYVASAHPYAGFEWKFDGIRVQLQASVHSCHSRYAALRLARAMWMKLAKGTEKEDVLQFRQQIYNKIEQSLQQSQVGKLETCVKREPSEEVVDMPAAKRGKAPEEETSMSSRQYGSDSPRSSPKVEAPSATAVSFSAGLGSLQDVCRRQGLGEGGSWSELIFRLESWEEEHGSTCSASGSEQGGSLAAAALADSAAVASTSERSLETMAPCSPGAGEAKQQETARRPPATPQQLAGRASGLVRRSSAC